MCRCTPVVSGCGQTRGRPVNEEEAQTGRSATKSVRQGAVNGRGACSPAEEVVPAPLSALLKQRTESSGMKKISGRFQTSSINTSQQTLLSRGALIGGCLIRPMLERTFAAVRDPGPRDRAELILFSHDGLPGLRYNGNTIDYFVVPGTMHPMHPDLIRLCGFDVETHRTTVKESELIDQYSDASIAWRDNRLSC